VPQLYPEIKIVDPNLGQNPKPTVDTTTLIANGWLPTNMWDGTNNKGLLKSNSASYIRYYTNLTDKEKSLQWWS